MNVLILDYRGYGKSEGEIKRENNLYLDAESGLEYLLGKKEVAIDDDIIIWGRSLGGVITINIAQDNNFSSVIIESTFFSMDSLTSSRFWFLPVKILSRFHFRNDEKIKNINSKILIIHSRDDDVIPFVNGENLFKEAGGG